MAKKHFEYRKRNGEEEMVIYYIENEQTGKRNYFVLERLPSNYQNNEKMLQHAKRLVEKYNKEKNKNAEIISLFDKAGNEHWFMQEPTSMIGAKAHALKNNLVVNFKKATKETKTKAIALGLATTILVGSIAGITALSDKSNDNQLGNDTVISGQVDTTHNSSFTTGFESITTPESPDTTVAPEEKEELKHTNLSSLTYKTTQNSDGSKVLELADALKIANACYENLQYELQNSNHNYSFDVSKFGPEMYVGEAVSENSLKVTENKVNQYGCRGMLMIGPDAVKEANEVAVKLTGRPIITDSKQLDNPVYAFMTCMYISVRNYEYCADIVGPEKVTPEMVYDCYLYGCGNLRKWLREDVEKNTPYEAKTYSKDILYYGECLEDYNDALEKGLTDGSHDSYWKDAYYNGLWKKPDWSKTAESDGFERE